jgi:hypothetical protein
LVGAVMSKVIWSNAPGARAPERSYRDKSIRIVDNWISP